MCACVCLFVVCVVELRSSSRSINQSIKGPHKATHGQGEATSQHHNRGQQTLRHEVTHAWGAVNESQQHLQIPARCPLFSSFKRTRDHVHTHTVAGAPSRLTRALRDPHTTAQMSSPTSASHPGKHAQLSLRSTERRASVLERKLDSRLIEQTTVCVHGLRGGRGGKA